MRRGGGVPDPDCPTSMEDMGYWVVVSRSRTETESLQRAVEMRARVESSDALGALMGSDGRICRLTGMPLSPDQGPSTSDLLRFVKETAAEVPTASPVFAKLQY